MTTVPAAHPGRQAPRHRHRRPHAHAEAARRADHQEAGYPDIDSPFWLGVVAPAGTPPEIIAKKLNKAFRDSLNAPGGPRTGLQRSAPTSRSARPDDFRAMLAKELALWTKVVKDNKVNAKSHGGDEFQQCSVMRHARRSRVPRTEVRTLARGQPRRPRCATAPTRPPPAELMPWYKTLSRKGWIAPHWPKQIRRHGRDAERADHHDRGAGARRRRTCRCRASTTSGRS